MANTQLKRGLKRATNLSVDPDLLKRAKALGINVSSVLDDSLRERIRREEERRWLEDNKEAFEALNRDTREHGVWSERLRRF
ncbi:MAG: type II toxin-antitoxin system CcdA family antitoxin [Micropepsaceae bacterium]